MLKLDPADDYGRPARQAELLKAVFDAQPEDESDWVEWKGAGWDLTHAETLGQLARYIIGFANRDPQRAKSFAHGKSFLIVGLEPGQAAGIATMDPAVLDDKLCGYLGTKDAPRWLPQYLEFNGVQVLVVVVEAPNWGDPIFHLHKGLPSGKHQQGDIFVREGSKTRKANSSDLQRLQERLVRGAKTELHLGLGLPGGLSVARIGLSTNAIDDWLASERTRLMTPLEKWEEEHRPKPQPSWMPMGADLSSFMSGDLAHFALQPRVDKRSADTYVDEVEEYLRRCKRTLFPVTVARAVAAGTNCFTLTVRNLDERNIGAVEVVLEAPAQTFFVDRHSDASLPDRPASWGMSTLLDFPALSYPNIVVPPGLYDPDISDDRREVRFDVGDLRPLETVSLERVAIVGEWEGGSVEVQWRATSKSVDVVLRGALSIAVAPKTLLLDRWVPQMKK